MISTPFDMMSRSPIFRDKTNISHLPVFSDINPSTHPRDP
jgi:hypothetical protein